MRSILCFGDSLTWGFNANDLSRFPFEKRWTGILQTLLGQKYNVIEAGLNGRTSVFCDEFTPFLQYGVANNTLPFVLDMHRPLDLVILMLGTNDLQPHRHRHIRDVARGVGRCVETTLKSLSGINGVSPKVLMIAPPALKPPASHMEMAFGNIVVDARELDRLFQLTARAYGVDCLTISDKVQATEIDGIHLDEKANQMLAELVAERVISSLGLC